MPRKDIKARNAANHSIWAVGSLASLMALIDLHSLVTFTPGDFPFKGPTYTESLVVGMVLLLPVLIAVHWGIHAYQKHSPRSQPLPGYFAGVEFPPSLKFARLALFCGLVLFPTLVFLMCVSRMYEDLRIVPAVAGKTYKDQDTHVKTGVDLLLDWGKRTDGKPSGPFASPYRWDSARDLHRNYEGKRSATSAYPGIQPALTTVAAAGLLASLGVMAFRAARLRPRLYVLLRSFSPRQGIRP